jgi:hypothetical protein
MALARGKLSASAETLVPIGTNQVQTPLVQIDVHDGSMAYGTCAFLIHP